MRAAIWLAVVGCLACGSKTRTAPGKEKAATGSTGEAREVSPAADTPPAPPARALRDALAALPTSPPLAPPLKHQLGSRYITTELLGFTEDYRAYALKITHDYFFGEDGVGEYNLRMYQVFDTWTGEGIAAFKIKASGYGSGGDERRYMQRMKRFAKQLRPRSEWKKWLAANPLVKAPAARKIDAGEFTLEVVGKTPFKSKLAAKPKNYGFHVIWTNLPSSQQVEDKYSHEQLMKGRVKLPKLLATWQPSGSGRLRSLEFRTELDWVNWMDDESLASSEMWVRPHASADGRRVVWIIQPAAIGHVTESNDPLGRLYVRSLGYQVKVVDAGSGMDHARRAAAHLEKNGITVTEVAKQDKVADVSKIYFRGPARSVATRAQTALPADLAIAELGSEGWVDVIIVLGRDAAPAP